MAIKYQEERKVSEERRKGVESLTREIGALSRENVVLKKEMVNEEVMESLQAEVKRLEGSLEARERAIRGREEESQLRERESSRTKEKEQNELKREVERALKLTEAKNSLHMIELEDKVIYLEEKILEMARLHMLKVKEVKEEMEERHEEELVKFREWVREDVREEVREEVREDVREDVREELREVSAQEVAGIVAELSRVEKEKEEIEHGKESDLSAIMTLEAEEERHLSRIMSLEKEKRDNLLVIENMQGLVGGSEFKIASLEMQLDGLRGELIKMRHASNEATTSSDKDKMVAMQDTDDTSRRVAEMQQSLCDAATEIKRLQDKCKLLKNEKSLLHVEKENLRLKAQEEAGKVKASEEDINSMKAAIEEGRVLKEACESHHSLLGGVCEAQDALERQLMEKGHVLDQIQATTEGARQALRHGKSNVESLIGSLEKKKQAAEYGCRGAQEKLENEKTRVHALVSEISKLPLTLTPLRMMGLHSQENVKPKPQEKDEQKLHLLAPRDECEESLFDTLATPQRTSAATAALHQLASFRELYNDSRNALLASEASVSKYVNELEEIEGRETLLLKREKCLEGENKALKVELESFQEREAHAFKLSQESRDQYSEDIRWLESRIDEKERELVEYREKNSQLEMTSLDLKGEIVLLKAGLAPSSNNQDEAADISSLKEDVAGTNTATNLEKQKSKAVLAAQIRLELDCERQKELAEVASESLSETREELGSEISRLKTENIVLEENVKARDTCIEELLAQYDGERQVRIELQQRIGELIREKDALNVLIAEGENQSVFGETGEALEEELKESAVREAQLISDKAKLEVSLKECQRCLQNLLAQEEARENCDVDNALRRLQADRVEAERLMSDERAYFVKTMEKMEGDLLKMKEENRSKIIQLEPTLPLKLPAIQHGEHQTPMQSSFKNQIVLPPNSNYYSPSTNHVAMPTNSHHVMIPMLTNSHLSPSSMQTGDTKQQMGSQIRSHVSHVSHVTYQHGGTTEPGRDSSLTKEIDSIEERLASLGLGSPTVDLSSSSRLDTLRTSAAASHAAKAVDGTFESMDKDGNGVIDRAEWDEMQTKLRIGLHHPGSQPFPETNRHSKSNDYSEVKAPLTTTVNSSNDMVLPTVQHFEELGRASLAQSKQLSNPNSSRSVTPRGPADAISTGPGMAQAFSNYLDKYKI